MTLSSPENLQTHKSQRLIVKISLLFILAILMIVGRSAKLWPVANWPMYHRYTPQYLTQSGNQGEFSTHFSKTSTSIAQLKVITKTGDIYWFLPGDLLSMSNYRIDQQLIEQAFDETDANQQQARFVIQYMIEKHLPKINIQSIEKWNMEWNEVNPINIPPLNRQKPDQSTLENRFDVNN